ncbi:MAG: NAD(P)-dependent alcohol dehydrogenase [Dehalococcoidales bacterium]|nr:MAG: NAD(P)-dependent alcohol dehydrogenase [Dehalococcoidales bacterium]
MKAIIYEKYGPPEIFQLKEVSKPVPKDDEILVKIHATTVAAEDPRYRSFNFPAWGWLPLRLQIGIFKPRQKILGFYFAGEVVSIGKNVTLFRNGDQVIGNTPGGGTYAQYVCLSEANAISKKPDNLTYEESVAVPNGALTALLFLRSANIQNGQKILINGASGTVGTAAVQLAKYFETEVTGVCSTGNMEFVRSLGADKVIDYTREDFTKSSQTYDIIFDVMGWKGFSRSKHLLKENGIYLTTNPGFKVFGQILWTKMTCGKRVKWVASGLLTKAGDLEYIIRLVEDGQIRPVIDRSYPLEKMAEAHRYVETGHKKGDVVITIAHSEIEV